MLKQLKIFIAILFLQPILNYAVLADGIIIPPPGVNIAVKYHRVTVNILDQVATTEVDQVFINDSDIGNVEGIYIFPIPEGATFTDFSMYVNGEEIHAEVMDAEQARSIYESIVRRNRDPGLLEYLGQGMFRARIFPIGAGEEKRVKLSYIEILPYDGGITRYNYPLSTEKFSSKPLEDVSITVNISSRNPIKGVFSPSHNVVVQKSDDYNLTAVYSDEQVKPETDFSLYYTVSPDEIGIHTFPYRDEGEPGFYLLLAAPKYEIDTEGYVKKRIIFTIDRSGSMSGEKIRQAKDALKFCVNSLNQGDRFNIVDFSSGVMKFRDEAVPASQENILSAISYISNIQAGGGTNINEALITSLDYMADDSLINMIIFLTDGVPTVGVINNEEIRNTITGRNTHSTRIFIFGVGYDVNTYLLDNISGDNHGTTVYVKPGDDIETAVSSFFEKVNKPALSDVEIDFGSIKVSDYHPKELTDIFYGSQLTQLGRYTGQGNTIISLKGRINEKVQEYRSQEFFPQKSTEYEFVPRLWAVRKIAYLLNQIRANGEDPEIVEEIVNLAKKYGIVTPYTSSIIIEGSAQPGYFSNFTQPQRGIEAVSFASNLKDYSMAMNTSFMQSYAIKYVGNKAFFFKDPFWIDVDYKAAGKIEEYIFASDEYFKLLRKKPELGKYFALGKNVIVKDGSVKYYVHEENTKIDISLTPFNFSLFQNYPNPFNVKTSIPFFLQDDAKIEIAIYNILGQPVKRLYKGLKSSGIHKVTWNGINYRGEKVSSGVYIYSLNVGKMKVSKKLILLR